MTKPSIAFAIAAAALFSTAACKDRVEREAEDVQEAREDVQDAKHEVREEKGELAEEKAEFSAALTKRLADAEARYSQFEARAAAIKARVAGTPTEAEIDRSLQLAQTQIEELRKAAPATAEREAQELETAMDRLEQALNQYDEAVGGPAR